MTIQNSIDFNSIADAVDIIKNNFTHQPSEVEIAKKIKISPSHLQKIFAEWAGVSLKKFTQYITLAYIKKMLSYVEENSAPTLFSTGIKTGLSGTGRLHNLFINIEEMTAEEFKNGGENLTIHYSFTITFFGNLIVASTSKGICHIAFIDDEESGLKNLFTCFPKANFVYSEKLIHLQVNNIFAGEYNEINKITLHLKGTSFQLKVWEELLKIPAGKLSTYGNIAHALNNPKAARAVGSAIGNNPVAYLIPCHRIIRATGLYGEYMWGAKRKTAMIGWEAVKANGLGDL